MDSGILEVLEENIARDLIKSRNALKDKDIIQFPWRVLQTARKTNSRDVLIELSGDKLFVRYSDVFMLVTDMVDILYGTASEEFNETTIAPVFASNLFITSTDCEHSQRIWNIALSDTTADGLKSTFRAVCAQDVVATVIEDASILMTYDLLPQQTRLVRSVLERFSKCVPGFLYADGSINTLKTLVNRSFALSYETAEDSVVKINGSIYTGVTKVNKYFTLSYLKDESGMPYDTFCLVQDRESLVFVETPELNRPVTVVARGAAVWYDDWLDTVLIRERTNPNLHEFIKDVSDIKLTEAINRLQLRRVSVSKHVIKALCKLAADVDEIIPLLDSTKSFTYVDGDAVIATLNNHKITPELRHSVEVANQEFCNKEILNWLSANSNCSSTPKAMVWLNTMSAFGVVNQEQLLERLSCAPGNNNTIASLLYSCGITTLNSALETWVSPLPKYVVEDVAYDMFDMQLLQIAITHGLELPAIGKSNKCALYILDRADGKRTVMQLEESVYVLIEKYKITFYACSRSRRAQIKLSTSMQEIFREAPADVFVMTEEMICPLLDVMCLDTVSVSM